MGWIRGSFSLGISEKGFLRWHTDVLAYEDSVSMGPEFLGVPFSINAGESDREPRENLSVLSL